jgi:catechol 2,3-dioxygenase-like lactoylglutathione lyase family enzyme
MQLNHVALTVRDHGRSAAFYTEHFGFTDRVHDDAYLLILSGPDGGLLALSEGEPAAEHLPRTNHSASWSRARTRYTRRCGGCARPACPRRSGRTAA